MPCLAFQKPQSNRSASAHVFAVALRYLRAMTGRNPISSFIWEMLSLGATQLLQFLPRRSLGCKKYATVIVHASFSFILPLSLSQPPKIPLPKFTTPTDLHAARTNWNDTKFALAARNSPPLNTFRIPYNDKGRLPTPRPRFDNLL
jgi:hypothetical protein